MTAARSHQLLSRVNYMHPFREGNGRTQRTFLNDVAALNRRVFEWAWVSSE